jgi:site-specific DNA-methyltransferase (adenine-specific)
MTYYWNKFLKDDGIFQVQTDFHTNYLVRYHFEKILKGTFVNHLVWKNEFGNFAKNKMHQCYDDIIVFSKGKNYKFYSEKIQVDKATKGKGLNPSGRETKTATAWIDDICLTTVAKERIRNLNGKCVKWQKPVRLYERIIAPFVSEGDWILDNFMGLGSLGEYCIKNDLNYVGIENDKESFELAKQRLESL